MLDTCQRNYVLLSMQESIRRDISAVLLKNYCNACIVRVAETISSK